MPAKHTAARWGAYLVVLLLTAALQSAQLPMRVYTTADGLPRERVNCIVPDSHGFLWLCTAEGLSRFDGYQFTNYGVAQGLAHRSINAFLETREGIYLAATEHGVSRLDPNAAPGSAAKFVSLPSSDGRPTQGVSGMVQDRAGTGWFGPHAGLYRNENLSRPA